MKCLDILIEEVTHTQRPCPSRWGFKDIKTKTCPREWMLTNISPVCLECWKLALDEEYEENKND